ncbi:Asp-hemolysin [Xylaria grammica]|nr:Asp-hemolysin [Xylaria grammica]
MASPQAYPQWVHFIITNSLREDTIAIQNAYLIRGKFYQNGNKDDEIQPPDVDKIRTSSTGTGNVYSCGRQAAAEGCEGGFEFHIEDGKKLGKIYFSCPWSGVYSNEVRKSEVADGYVVDIGDYPTGGALGIVTIKIAKLA